MGGLLLPSTIIHCRCRCRCAIVFAIMPCHCLVAIFTISFKHICKYCQPKKNESAFARSLSSYALHSLTLWRALFYCDVFHCHFWYQKRLHNGVKHIWCNLYNVVVKHWDDCVAKDNDNDNTPNFKKNERKTKKQGIARHRKESKTRESGKQPKTDEISRKLVSSSFNSSPNYFNIRF